MLRIYRVVEFFSLKVQWQLLLLALSSCLENVKGGVSLMDVDYTITDDKVTLVGAENYASNIGTKDKDFGSFHDSGFTTANQGTQKENDFAPSSTSNNDILLTISKISEMQSDKENPIISPPNTGADAQESDIQGSGDVKITKDLDINTPPSALHNNDLNTDTHGPFKANEAVQANKDDFGNFNLSFPI